MRYASVFSQMRRKSDLLCRGERRTSDLLRKLIHRSSFTVNRSSFTVHRREKERAIDGSSLQSLHLWMSHYVYQRWANRFSHNSILVL